MSLAPKGRIQGLAPSDKEMEVQPPNGGLTGEQPPMLESKFTEK